MKSPFASRSVWFLTGSQDLYGEETLATVARQSRAISDRLATDLPVAVHWVPVLKDSDSILRTILAANADDSCIGSSRGCTPSRRPRCGFAGWTPLGKPLLHFHTQSNETLPWSTLDMDFMNLNQAAHGDREFGFVQTRLGLPRKTVVGHVNEASTRERIAAWARVATGWDSVRHLKLARFGDNMRGVAVTDGDKVEAELHFGTSVNTYAVNDLVDVVDAVPGRAVDELIVEYLDVYDVAPELRPGHDRHEALRYGARVEAGLAQFLTEGGFGAFTTNFEDSAACANSRASPCSG